jgi:hypothetical protein
MVRWVTAGPIADDLRPQQPTISESETTPPGRRLLCGALQHRDSRDVRVGRPTALHQILIGMLVSSQ